MDADDRTLAAYDLAADRYAAAQTVDPGAEVVALMDRVVEVVGRGARLLEVGGGSGRDARLLGELGLLVTVTDAVPAFVTMMRADGLDARLLDVRHDDLGGPWDAIWANAVLLHLSRSEMAAVLDRLREATRSGGVVVFTVKEGDGEAWSTAKIGLPRHFTFWQEDALRALLTEWRSVEVRSAAGLADDWLMVIARP